MSSILERIDKSLATGLISITDEKKLLDEDKKLLLEVCVLLPFLLGQFERLEDVLTHHKVRVIIEPGIPKRAIPFELEDDEEKEILIKMPLRGLYDGAQKVIKLFPEEMETEYGGSRMNELLVSTLAHEAMHAYFDNHPDNDKKYIYSVEEPLAEFGMLLYLKETKQEDYYQWSLADVCSKQTRYRYGAALMDQHLRELGKKLPLRTRRDLESYKRKLL